MSFLLWIFILSFSDSAYAAKDALVVTSSGADIYEKPDFSSSILEHVRQGSAVHISSDEKNGWYHVIMPQLPQLQENRLGWIRSKDVSVETYSKELKAAGIQQTIQMSYRQPSRRLWILYGFYQISQANPSSLQTYAGDIGKPFLLGSYGFEFGYRLTSVWTLSGHMEFFQFRRASTGATSDPFANYNGQGNILALNFDYTWFHSVPWKVGVDFGVGESIANTVGNGTSLATNTSDGFSGPALLGKLTGCWYAWNQIALKLEIGYKYLAKKSVSLGGSKVDVNLSAPFIGAGMQFEF